LIEVVVGAGIVAFGVLVFTLGVKFLNVVDHREKKLSDEVPLLAKSITATGD
jgi:Ni/Fe-hydrogenase subunit HybB-like protein